MKIFSTCWIIPNWTLYWQLLRTTRWHGVISPTLTSPTRFVIALPLLMNVGRWDTASAWLDALPDVQVSPADIAAQAAMSLAHGDIEGALNRLRPATDPDWRRAKVFWQPDRWADNLAAQMYYLLTGDIAARDGATTSPPPQHTSRRLTLARRRQAATSWRKF